MLVSRGILVVTVSLLITGVFSGLNRPLWIDEFLHVALSGLPWLEVRNYIALTSSSTNHGQTWFYQVLSIFLLHLFGPSLLGVRLISWAATFALLVSTYYFLRLFYVSIGIRLFTLGLILANRYFSFEMSNGRPYMVLVATTALAAYGLLSLQSSERTGFKSKLLFGLVVVVGALNHPYFPVILGTLFIAIVLLRALQQTESRRSIFMLLRTHLVLTVLSGSLSVVVGQLTWMREIRDFVHFDSFRAFKKYGLDVGLSEFVVATVVWGLTALFYAFWVIRTSKRLTSDPRLVIGSLLIVAGTALSLFFTWVSVLRNYWIFPRQWLPGAFLVFIGIALLLAVLFSYLAKRELRVVAGVGTIIVWAAAVTMIVFGSARELSIAAENRAWWENLSPLSLESAVDDGNRFWVVAGNLNIKCDTTVWPELALYYSHPPPESMLEEIQGKASACKESD